MLPNPYSPGASPAYLAGRGGELATIENVVSTVRQLGRPGGPLLAFYGQRGTGKTSLLRVAQDAARRAGVLTAWVTGSEDRPLAELLAKSIRAAMAAEDLEARGRGFLHRLDQVQVELGVPGAKVSAQVRGGGQLGDAAAAAVHELLEDTGRFAANHDKHGLVVFVDEFQEARRADRRAMLIALQEFDGDLAYPCPVAVVAAGLPSIHGAVTEAATFGERTRFVEVKGLTAAAAAEALAHPAEDLSVRWDQAAITAAAQLAGSYPYRVQLVGACTWDAARPESGDTISVGHVSAATGDVEDRMDTLYRTRWAAARPEHRRILAAIAGGGSDTATREEIASRAGRSSSALSRPRDQLIDRGLIEPVGRGTLRFTIPGFGDFVRRQVQLLGADGAHEIFDGDE